MLTFSWIFLFLSYISLSLGLLKKKDNNNKSRLSKGVETWNSKTWSESANKSNFSKTKVSPGRDREIESGQSLRVSFPYSRFIAGTIKGLITVGTYFNVSILPSEGVFRVPRDRWSTDQVVYIGQVPTDLRIRSRATAAGSCRVKRRARRVWRSATTTVGNVGWPARPLERARPTEPLWKIVL